MYSIIQLIALFSKFLFGSSLVVNIGNYSELNPKDCGLSRVSSQVNTNCFKWHKDTNPSLKRGKNVGFSDAPWMAFIEYKRWVNNREMQYSCTGSVISNQWILTAAHCVKSSYDIDIYLGYNFTRNSPSKSHHYYKSDATYMHPKWGEYTLNGTTTSFKMYDLAMIRMNKPINTSDGENSICLPQKLTHWSRIGGFYEYVMVAGWGGPTLRLQMAEFKLINLYNIGITAPMANLFNLNRQTVCKGDSGSPVWQYQMGRAVIAAVIYRAHTSDNECVPDDYPLATTATWVDLEIDWIKNVTQLA